MKLKSEHLYEEELERVMIIHSNIKIYGRLCALEGMLDVVNSGGSRNEYYYEGRSCSKEKLIMILKNQIEQIKV